MSVVLKPGDIGVDYSGLRLDTAAEVKGANEAHIKFVLRYSAGAASDPSHPSHGSVIWKLISPEEHKAVLARGWDMIANDEWYESRITEGYAAGREDGKAAGALWRRCGHARGARVYCSLDTAPSILKYRKIAAYLRGWRDGCGGYYVPDVYGGTPLLRWLIRRGRRPDLYGWRPNAGSWSNDGLPYQPSGVQGWATRAKLLKQAQAATPAHIWQTGNYMFNNNADENMILRVPVGSHLEMVAAGKPTPPPVPVPTPAPTPDPTPQPKPLPLKTGQARELVSQDGNAALHIHPDGTLAVWVGGKHTRSL